MSAFISGPEAIHTHECNGWRIGTRYRPCTCGALEEQKALDAIWKKNKLRVERAAKVGALEEVAKGFTFTVWPYPMTRRNKYLRVRALSLRLHRLSYELGLANYPAPYPEGRELATLTSKVRVINELARALYKTNCRPIKGEKK